MTEPHWPADGSGDEADGGYDPTAYPSKTWLPEDELGYTERVEAMAVALHEDCILEWQAIGVADPGRLVTKHSADAHYGRAHDLVRRLTLERRLAPLIAAAPDPTYHPGDYESPHTAPFVQVRVNGELVPGHIVYPWPEDGLVVEPLEVAG